MESHETNKHASQKRITDFAKNENENEHEANKSPKKKKKSTLGRVGVSVLGVVHLQETEESSRAGKPDLNESKENKGKMKLGLWGKKGV